MCIDLHDISIDLHDLSIYLHMAESFSVKRWLNARAKCIDLVSLHIPKHFGIIYIFLHIIKTILTGASFY